MTRPVCPLLSNITSITFDVDDTLWDFHGVMRGALSAVLDELSQFDPEAEGRLDVDKMISIRDDTHDRLRNRVTDLNAIREESIKQALREADAPNDELGSYLTHIYFRHRNSTFALFPDVRPALEQLAQKYRLGLLSNGNTDAASMGISDLISFEVFSQDHRGIEKPDRRIFDIAMEQAGCPAHRIVHVGDSLENDVIGASNAGLQPVWLNRTGASARDGVAVELKSLEQLAALLP